MVKRVLVTGGNGMLGTDVCLAFQYAGAEVIATGIAGGITHMDVTDGDSVQRVFHETAPDLVIHCAAYTQVDLAESQPDLAHAINVIGSQHIAEACSSFDIPLCAIGTDFVFDGTKHTPYVETDMPAPNGVYAQTKLAGEQRVLATCSKSWIARTAWLYGLHGSCFPNTILKRIVSGGACRVVADQTGSPTYTADLAAALVSLTSTAPYGIYNVVSEGQATWFELARLAVEFAGLDESLVTPIATSEWPSPVERPKYSVLDTAKLRRTGIQKLRPWREALASYVAARAAKQAD